MSERQWPDIVGVPRTGGDPLDREYLRHWAAVLGVGDLLGRADAEANPARG